ncbi:MAG: hypothetical protein V3S24_20450 [Candidatus Tectomicrobia bacterium]
MTILTVRGRGINARSQDYWLSYLFRGAINRYIDEHNNNPKRSSGPISQTPSSPRFAACLYLLIEAVH